MNYIYLHMIIRCRQPPKRMVLKKVRGGGILRIQLMVQKSTAPVDSFIFKSPEIMGFFREIYRLAWLARFHPGAFPEASLPSVSCDFCGGHGASSSTPPSCLLGSLEFWRRQFTLKAVRNRFFLWRPSCCEAFFLGEV